MTIINTIGSIRKVFRI